MSESTSKQAVTQQLSKQREVQRIRDELSDCTSCSGIGVIYDNVVYNLWESMAIKGKIIPKFALDDHSATIFKAIAESIAPPAAAESSDYPFIIAVFISGLARSSALDSRHGHLSRYHQVIPTTVSASSPAYSQTLLHLCR